VSADLRDLREQFVARLVAEGWLTSPTWQRAFREVPRHVFLRRFFRLAVGGERWEAVADGDPAWARLVYSDAVLSTQLDNCDRWDSARHGAVSGTSTSSSTQPSLMATVLEALAAEPGHRVLEVGTGTGYNAALLAHCLGAGTVTSVEVDAEVLRTAAAALTEAASPRTTLVVGNGDDGHAEGAPFDRLVATYAVPVVPPAWIEQLAPGAVMVVPLALSLQVGLVVRLVADGNGAAHGTLLPLAAHFMPTRGREAVEAHDLVRVASRAPAGAVHRSALPEPVTDGPDGWTALAGLLLPDVHRVDLDRTDGSVQWLVAADGSWAYHRSADGVVEQGGPRRLWSGLEQIHKRWQEAGSPERRRIGVTARRDGSIRVWVDDSAHTIGAPGTR
jgi:methyltransferase of ATP-grasp peptide maturase system